MQIAKFVHSCVRLESEGTRLLFDPGLFSRLNGRVTVEQIGPLDAIVITHGHADHLDAGFVRAIVDATGARVLGNADMRATLGAAGITVDVFESGTRAIGAMSLEAFPAPHAPIVADTLPTNTAIRVNGTVLNPGDSFAPVLDRCAGTPTLLLPVMAPWTAEVDVMAFARRMAPRHVVPLHDGYVIDLFLQQRYDNYQSALARIGATLHASLTPGVLVDVP